MAEDLPLVVVGTLDLGESDRVVRLLSASEGRISAVARRARVSRRRFAGLFELGNRIRVQRGPSRSGLAPIHEAELVTAPVRARGDIDRIAALAYGCELCAALAPEAHPAPKLARLLAVWLDLLEGEIAPDTPCRIALEAKALTFAGLMPVLLRCTACGERIEAPAIFEHEGGGARHAGCGGGRSVPIDALIWMEALRRTPLAQLPGTPTPPELAGLHWLLSDFAQHHLGRALQSRRLLETLGEVGGAGPTG